MKIYNKKGFISGSLGILLSLTGFILMFFKDISIKSIIVLSLVLLFSIIKFIGSLSQSKTSKDIVISNDERDKFIQLKTSHKSLEILGVLNFIITIILMIVYGITKNKMFIPAILITSAYITISFILLFITNIYYEKHI